MFVRVYNLSFPGLLRLRAIHHITVVVGGQVVDWTVIPLSLAAVSANYARSVL